MKELAVIIRVPAGASEVLVRMPHSEVPDDLTVDFRPSPAGCWTPAVFFEPGCVKAHVQ